MRAAVSTRTQISCASGISSSPFGESTTRMGVPAILAGNLYVADCPDRGTAGLAGRRSDNCLAHLAAGEVRDVVASGGKRHAFGEGNLHFEAHQFFGVVYRVRAFEMEDRLAAAALAEPAGSNPDAPRVSL